MERLDAIAGDVSCLYWAGALDRGDPARGPPDAPAPMADVVYGGRFCAK